MDNPIIQLGIRRAISRLTDSEVGNIYWLLASGKDYSHVNNSHFIRGLYAMPFIDNDKLTTSIRRGLAKRIEQI